MSADLKLTMWDRIAAVISPSWALSRLRARAAANTLVRHYEAAQSGRRTSGWHRTRGDADSVNAAATTELRIHARDLARNNAYAKHAIDLIANNTVGYGITPRPVGDDKAANLKASEIWKLWADSTECDSESRSTFGGMLSQAMKATVPDGEVLIRRRMRRLGDGLSIPLQIQLLEADYLDSAKDGPVAGGGKGWITQGVEFDALGRRAAYWLYQEHPGSGQNSSPSRRVPAKDVLHCFLPTRPHQTRGVSWLAPVIGTLKDLDDYEDAELIKQKIAACFSAAVTDQDGLGTPIGAVDSATPLIEELQPGAIIQLPPGKEITTLTPPTLTSDALPTRNLRKVATGIGIPYEELAGDYSQVNFSSARMSRISHLGNLRSWQWNMLIPQVCAGVWAWAMEAAVLSGQLRVAPRAEWTVSPLPMIEPDKEGLAYQRLLRVGTITHDDMIREQGGDPVAHWQSYSDGLKNLKALGIQLDSVTADVSQAGLTQARAGAGGGAFGSGAEEKTPPPKDEEKSVELSEDFARELLGLKR